MGMIKPYRESHSENVEVKKYLFLRLFPADSLQNSLFTLPQMMLEQ